jgi:hypothetical protein
MQTNRDLYLAIAALIEQQKNNCRSLEEYLRALEELARHYRQRPALPLDAFIQLHSAAFTTDAPPFDVAWETDYAKDTETSGFPGWQATLREQIVDLHEMQENGQLNSEYRYFGIKSPRGAYWYNFDPSTFLECAAQGFYGGWEPGDVTSRGFVPGPVAVLENDGTIGQRDPRELSRPTLPISQVTWDDFRNFLRQGQWYE